MTNTILQWSGAACLLTMYTLMSFAPGWHPWNIVAGLGGAVCFLIWTIRTGNTPQMIVNATAIVIGVAGLWRAWG